MKLKRERAETLDLGVLKITDCTTPVAVDPLGGIHIVSAALLIQNLHHRLRIESRDGLTVQRLSDTNLDGLIGLTQNVSVISDANKVVATRILRDVS